MLEGRRHIFPVLFRIGSFEVSSFGALGLAGTLVGLWLFRQELARSTLVEKGIDAVPAGVIGGVVGAKLLWVLEHFGERPVIDLLLNRGGMSWYGGFTVGMLAVLWVAHHRQLPKMTVLAATTPSLAAGAAIGRIGCFLVGDDYGRPTDLPWALAFPAGMPPTTVPVHPTQLYEMAALVPLAFLLIRWRSQGRPDVFVLGGYLLLAGAIRFAIEFLRVNQRVLAMFSVAHLASLMAIGLGVALLLWTPRPSGRPLDSVNGG